MKTKKNKRIKTLSKFTLKKETKKTFYVNTDDSTKNNFISDILKKYGYIESTKFPVDFIYLASSQFFYKNKINARNSNWINKLYGKSIDKITDKIEMHKFFGKQHFFVPTIFIENNVIPRLPRKFIKILKPASKNSGYGKGISIVQSRKEVKDWISKNTKYNKWVLQDYLLNTDLYKGHKFHFRIYLILIVRKNKPFELYIANLYNVVTSKSIYVKNKFDDKDIHNTHSYGRISVPVFPKDLPDGWTKEDANDKIKEIKHIFKFIFQNEKEFTPEWGAINGFNLFGADIMFENKKTYLIEINRSPGYPLNNLISDQVNLILNKSQSTYERIF